jgi:hypothetical protein
MNAVCVCVRSCSGENLRDTIINFDEIQRSMPYGEWCMCVLIGSFMYLLACMISMLMVMISACDCVLHRSAWRIVCRISNHAA